MSVQNCLQIVSVQFCLGGVLGIVHVSKHDRYQIEIKTEMVSVGDVDKNEQVDVAISASGTGYCSF